MAESDEQPSTVTRGPPEQPTVPEQQPSADALQPAQEQSQTDEPPQTARAPSTTSDPVETDRSPHAATKDPALQDAQAISDAVRHQAHAEPVAPMPSKESNGAGNGISADEIALYDRQIRLWGMDAQEKIRNANILLVNIQALGNEIAKNLVLAGVGSLTVIDTALVTEDDLGSQFLVTEADIGKNRAEVASDQLRKLNPRVPIHAQTVDIQQAGLDFFAKFSIVIATDLPITTLTLINVGSRLANIPFYAAGSHGWYGFAFADLIQHTFAIKRTKSNVATQIGTQESATRTVVDVVEKRETSGAFSELVTKRETYQPLQLVNTSPLPEEYMSNRRRLRRITPLLPCLRALWEFEKQLQRPPGHNSQDLQLFTQLATEKSRELQLPAEHLQAEFLRSFLQNLYSEIAPVTAFLGGSLAQDVINVLGQREQPLQNMMFFDGEEMQGVIYALKPMLTTEDVQI